MASGELRATFRHNPDGGKEKYPDSKVILLISVGQHYHEGEKFGATINLLNRSRFKFCSIMLGDSIQRHNLAIGDYRHIDLIHKEANLLGDDWLERKIEELVMS